jgi:ferredoxin, 2Fe-2S
MPKVSYVIKDGRKYEVDGQEGHSLMQIAVDNNIPGIDAQCGGACTCATCHIYVRAEWQERIPAPDELEAGMLDFAEAEVRSTSRLACQIKITPELDGLIVDVPK